MPERTTNVDFVAKGGAPGEWKMVLVEGPWRGSIDDQLHRVQERMFGCIDAALDGQLAERFPESRGGRVTVQLDCYNVPRDEVEAFFQRFSSGVFFVGDYRQALAASEFVQGIGFEVNFERP